MASSKFKIVVQGEASETDSDEEVYITSMPSVSTSSAGLRVPGEASETDSEGEVEKACKQAYAASSENAQSLRRDLPALIVIRNTPESPPVQEDRWSLKQECRDATLLQQKLQESNARLSADVAQTFRQVYQNATRDIRMATACLNNSQSGIINASHSIRLLLEDLKSVSEKVDIITSCNLLPDITIPPPISGQ
ncbi:biogenesis of lysosome-related organelles complex 1 subunit 3 [Denticeps clupeoides]|uniref:biogenesis of lysosome-related organelles complex 1 subunit 3 n=1 Tax=Denticeps clupeoides TaxID=299321 RepID=UPI0010A4AC53|nr:biogenesis of lysosome-related organelles complex 1 subunit 3 [Denticeps clupeoides]